MVIFARKLQHPRQIIRKKGKFIWEKAVYNRYLLIGLNILLYKYIYIYAQTHFKGSSREIEQQINDTHVEELVLY